MDPSATTAAHNRFQPQHDHDRPSPSPQPSILISSNSEDQRHIALSREMLMKPFFPGQPKSLSGIALRAFCLGISLTVGLIAVAGILLFSDSPLWRAPFFLCALSVFHFLEFWTTAEGNPTVACIDSFLLTSNWPSYAVAHSAAFLECLIVGVFFPNRAWVPSNVAHGLLALGLCLTMAGQIVRSVAMIHAGASFNHHIQTRRAESHTLVTTGMYGIMRHPSYTAFFYWGLGTQLVLGNIFCFTGYSAVLWLFFKERIRIEEGKLVEFFQEDYVNYRKRVGTFMPFIR